MSSPAFPVHRDTYEQSPERQLIAIALTVSKDATTQTGLNVCTKDIVRELVSVNTSRIPSILILAINSACSSCLIKTTCLKPVNAFVGGIVRNSNSN